MLLKCNCSHCAAHLEFESDHIGTVISCPKCGRPTKLTLSGEPPAETRQPAAAPSARRSGSEPAANSPAATLQTVRAATCYPVLRRLINVLFIVSLVFIALYLVVGILWSLRMFGMVQSFSHQTEPWAGSLLSLARLFMVLLVTGLSVLSAIMVKHLLTVFVDIGDCKRRLKSAAGSLG